MIERRDLLADNEIRVECHAHKRKFQVPRKNNPQIRLDNLQRSHKNEGMGLRQDGELYQAWVVLFDLCK